MYGKLHKMNHVNSNPIGMGNLCSTLQSLAIHYKRCMRVDRRGVCGVLSFSPSLPFQKAVIESASISTGEVLLVSVRKYIELEVPKMFFVWTLSISRSQKR